MVFQMPLAVFLCMEIECYCVWKFVKNEGIILLVERDIEEDRVCKEGKNQLGFPS